MNVYTVVVCIKHISIHICFSKLISIHYRWLTLSEIVQRAHTHMHKYMIYIFTNRFITVGVYFFVAGFPKVVPAPGTITPPQCQGSIRRQSRALECLAPPRKGSFRQRHSPVHQNAPQDRPPLAFCKRRLSWPEVDPRSTSG